jgi:S-adenosylhomocysteine hydrolase
VRFFVPRLRLLLALLLAAVATPAFAVAKKEFSPAELARMGGDWERMRPEAFFKKYPMSARVFARIRRETGAFPHKIKGIQPDEVDALKEDYFYVVAGLRKESVVLEAHGIGYHVVDNLREKPEHALDLPKSKGRTLGALPKLPEKAVEDWMKVRAGDLTVPAFRKKWPKVRAGELAAVQDHAKAAINVPSGVKGKRAAAVLKLSAAEIERARALSKPTAKISEELLDKLRAQWPRVERKEISQLRLAQEIGIPIHQLQLHKQLNPGEFEMPEAGLSDEQRSRLKKRWPEVLAGKISMNKMLRQENVALATFYAHRQAHEDEFVLPQKGRFKAADAEGESPWSEQELDEMRPLFEKFHRAELNQAQLYQRLRRYGINSPVAREHLRKADEEAFSSREDFLDRHFDDIIDDLIHLAEDKRDVIHRWQDFTDLAERDVALKTKWGPLRVSTNKGWVVLRDRRGERRLHEALERIGVQIGKGALQKAAKKASGVAAEEEVAPAQRKSGGERELAELLSERLDGIEPSKETLLSILDELAPGHTKEQLWKKWIYLRRRLGAVYPELERWDVDNRHQPYSLRYIARWAMALHEAGPNASHDQVVEIFKRSQEYEEDGRIPSNAGSERNLTEMARRYPELVTATEPRAQFQKKRQLIELLRTAPKDKNLYDLAEELEQIGYPYTATVYHTLAKLTPADAEHMGYSWKLVAQIRKKRTGLGQPKDDRFDPNLEPPGVDLKLARDILDTPRIPSLLRFALQRLAKRKGTARPFAASNVMFINHRYSDLVPFVETMIEAGMAPKNSVFVSTPYPFADAVTYQLRKLGVDTMVPEQNMESMEATVDKGIAKMLATYEDQSKRWASPHPILILDDGGMAAKIIAKKYKEHFSKFRIVEITAAGERIVQELEKTYGRVPFVYFSIAYSEAKQLVTSQFYGNRVVDKVMKLMPQTGIEMKNKRVAVRGGGPMGLFAAGRLREEYGMDVTIIEPNAEKAAMCRDAGFRVEEPEKALPGRGLVLGMSGYPMEERLMQYIDDGAFVAQGSSKRQEFPMDHVEKASTGKEELPRSDGLPQKSYTYKYRPQRGKARRLHFLGDGWTINHDGSLAGTPIEDIALELALVFESAVEAADTARTDTGKFRVLGKDVQDLYIKRWEAEKPK